jgi:hypothetical protein
MANAGNDIIEANKTQITVVESLPDYSNDPFFLKKLEEAYKALAECPPPDFILKRMRGEE